MNTTEQNRGRREKLWVFDLSWLVVPVVFYLVFEWGIGRLIPETQDSDLNLLLFQAVLFVLVVGFALIAGKTRIGGWTLPKSYSWLWVAGPLWLGVFTPIGAAATFYQSEPEKVILFAVISFLVAVNEETLFRGFMLRGLMKSMPPIVAVLLSSLVFGGMHLLNLNAGGDPVFVAAQIIAAAGTGAILAAVTLRAGSILPATFLHFAADFAGLGALGGYEQVIQSPELAPSLVVTGFVFFAWGLFWTWRAVVKEKVFGAGD